MGAPVSTSLHTEIPANAVRKREQILPCVSEYDIRMWSSGAPALIERKGGEEVPPMSIEPMRESSSGGVNCTNPAHIGDRF